LKAGLFKGTRSDSFEPLNPLSLQRRKKQTSVPNPAISLTTFLLLNQALDDLNPEEQFVLRTLYGLDNGEAQSLEALAKRIGCDRTDIENVSAEALRGLMRYGKKKAE
jgi:DNA-directed RNA polymerase sigma subunit (sigma70/sigma32)